MSTYKERLNAVRTNPALMQELMYSELENQLAGKGSYDVPDASGPFPFLMEASTLNAAMVVNENQALMRRLYPSMAINQEELYLHMSDEDYLGRFASPAWSVFELFLGREEVLAKAVSTDENGIKKLVIPRLTEFRVGGVPFTMQYPIEIRLMSHGSPQIVYDTDVSSPIQTLETNMVDWQNLMVNREEILLLKVPVGQFGVSTRYETLNAAAGFDVNYTFDNQFYYARIYLENAQGGWTEIHTTHTAQVYDPAKTTAVLQVNGQSLNVKIPLIYFSQGLSEGEIRVDIYTTHGRLEMDAGSYTPSQYELILNSIDDEERYVAPLKTFSRIQPNNPHRIDGGTDGIDFPTLRERVITNSLGDSRVPITHAQLGTVLENRGYDVVTNVDNITNRQFLASRQLPSPDNAAISGGVGCIMGQIQGRMETLSASVHTVDNGERLTLLPSMLYAYDNGKIEPLPDGDIASLLNTGPDALTRQVSDQRLLYTPLHYVLDTTRDAFNVRPYYLDSPEVIRKTFVAENDTAQIQVGIDSYNIVRIAGGYRLTVKLKSGDRFKGISDGNIVVQLGYRPVGETSYASINGTMVGIEDKERIYTFDILTDYDIDRNHQLYTTNLSMFDEAQRDFSMPLEHDFDISFLAVNQDLRQYRVGEIDQLLQHHLLPENVMAITRERLRIRFGHNLENLWRRNRTIVTSKDYERYPEDIPYLYSKTVLETDSDGNILIDQDADGNPTYNVIHEKGDPVLDSDGNPTLKYRKGQIKLDDEKQPILKSPRKLLREFTLFLMDGVYYFVTDEEAISYREAIGNILVDWISNDLTVLEGRLLEQSELYLYPTQTLGDTVAVVREGLSSSLSLDQHFYVNYYMTDTAYNNIRLRESLSESTRAIVSEMLAKKTVAISDIIARLKTNGGEDVISIEAGGLGDDNNFSTITVTDDAVRLSLRRRLAVLANQLLTVQDGIDISFLRHSQR